jgi:hypothetical protein
MRNYQLYRTNVLLGGQMQLDLVLGKKDNRYLQVNNVHLSPISPYVPFTYSPDENILLYNHQDNIREHYKKIEGSFYQTFLTPELKHDWPIIVETEEEKNKTKIYNDTYIYGCRRIPYGRYNEEFAVLVPLWIEEVDHEIRFEINLYNSDASSDAPFATKIVKISKDSDDNFSQYFFNYLKYASLTKRDTTEDSQDSVDNSTNDNVINITFNKSAYVHGLECTSGNIITKDISQLAYNITSRERPLMEVDNMIINSFKDNHMICKQLFNFNLCFSLEDFIPAGLFSKDFNGVPVRTAVDVYIDDVLLDKYDFFNNYEVVNNQKIYRRRYFAQSSGEPSVYVENTTSNALNYLEDYNCLDLINKNKLSQSIIHWSLTGQNDYIFNTYGGFQGRYEYTNAGDVVYDYETYFIDIKGKYEPTLTNANWLNFIPVEDIKNILSDKTDYDGIQQYSKLAALATKFDLNESESIRHGIKYRGLETPNITGVNSIYVFAVWLSDINNSPFGNISTVKFNDGSVQINEIVAKDVNPNSETYKRYIEPFKDSKMYAICCTGPESLYFYDFMNNFKQVIESAPEPLKTLYNLMSTATEPTTIKFNKSLTKVFKNSPDIKTKEFQYYKLDTGVNKYINRYDGSIRPTFISLADIQKTNSWKNRIYYKKIFTRPEFAESSFKKYGGTKYLPLYNSIGYFAIEYKDMDYNFYVSDPETFETALNLQSEYPWYDMSKIIYVKPQVHFNIKNQDIRVINIKDSIVAELQKLYCSWYTDPAEAKKAAEDIYNMYDIKIDWEYSSTENIYIYDYIVDMNLK